jgi:type IV secretory pathway VirB6-like protein
MFFTALWRELLLGSTALLAVQTYAEFVLPFALREFPGELAALFSAAGTPQQAGIPGAFDAVMNASTQMYEIVVQRVPDSWAVPIIALRLKLELIYLLSYLLVAWGFFMAIVFHSISVLLVTIGPIFVGMAPFAALRGYARGWLSALLATLGIVAMLALVLGIMVRVVNAEAQVLVGMDQNTIMDQQISGYMGVVIVLFILACSMTAIPAVIASIFGGASHLMSPFMAGASAVASGVRRGGSAAVGVVWR